MNKYAKFVAIVMSLAMSLGARAAFEKINTYSEDRFSDVSNTAWYAKEVESTYELGLMNGISDSLFSPDGNVTIAEAITMASRVCATYNGKEISEKDGQWYEKYVSFAIENGIIDDVSSYGMEAPAKRYEVAEMFAKALPKEYFDAQNSVENIPDIPKSREYYDELLMLYNCGVVMGSDSYGNFFPESNITRAEAAAIINRVALPENRLKKSLDIISDDDAYELCLPTTYSTGKDTITSGWLLDNRGGVPRTNIADAYGTLMDIRTDAGTAMIREFNKTQTGMLDIRTGVKLSGEKKDGVYLEFQNDKGDSVYRIETMDSEWKILLSDGSYKTICSIDGVSAFSFHIKLDLDNNRCTTAVNGKNCGTYSLAVEKEKANIINFRFATTDESTATVALEPLDITVNYQVFKYVYPENDGMLPAWILSDGADVVTNQIVLDKGENASVAFDTISGKIISEFSLILPEGECVNYSINGKNGKILEFASDEKAFYANSIKFYEGYYHNLWYRLRFELDTDTGKILVKLNGRKITEVDFANADTSASSIYMANDGESAVKFTDFRVFREIYRDDYVPMPQIPDGADDYVIGMNVCSLWKNGNHYGWSCISPYTDHELVLGYYDEGNPETADWEIKYTVEHGIDFQAFCVFFGNLDGVQKLSADHLFNGFMNAKYSDMAKYCIIWEATSGGAPGSMQSWKEHFVPYFIENFFKDERYIVIDNQPVVCVFSPTMLSSRIGSDAKCKEMFDYLEDEVNRIFGYDGVIFLACGTSNDKFADMGFDGCYAYSWSTAGSSMQVNKDNMVQSGDQGSVYNVPTVSVGFNSVAWHGKRFPVMTHDDYRSTNEWVRDKYLQAYPKEKWQESFVMLSTWNEYGEGTYIMPTAEKSGFGYLDVIREVYTKEKSNASLNTIPTDAQKARINRLYPQYRHIIRKEGYITEALDEKNVEIIKTIDYGTVENLKVWGTREHTKDENGVTGLSGIDPILQLENITDVDTAEVDYIRITAKTPIGHEMMVLFTTDEETSWTEDKGIKFTSTTDEMTTYLVSTKMFKKWSGKLTGLRIDPVVSQNVTYTVKSAEFIGEGTSTPNTMIINGLRFDTSFRPIKKNSDTFIVFDPSVGMEYRLNCFAIYNKNEGILTLEFVNHTFVFTVGSDKYTLDGKEIALGCKIELLDGLVLVPINRICEANGYEFATASNGEISIVTDQKGILDEYYKETPYGSFEFNTPGNTEGFTSSFMSLVVNDGYMSCTSITASNDPTILYEAEEGIRLPSSEYTKLEMRVKYDFDAREDITEMKFKIYFTTDKQNSLSEWKSIQIPLEGSSTEGDWVTYTVDLATCAPWQDTITYLRIDPFDSQGTFDIDYLRFIK